MSKKVNFSDGLKNSSVKYIEFGKLILQTKYLEENKLLVKYKNCKGPVPNFKQMNISDSLRILIQNLIDTKQINYELIQDCKQNERDLFEQLLKKADLITVLKYKRVETKVTDEDLIQKFNVLQGELMAGSDAPAIKKELKAITEQLIAKGKITEADGKELISELEI